MALRAFGCPSIQAVRVAHQYHQLARPHRGSGGRVTVHENKDNNGLGFSACDQSVHRRRDSEGCFFVKKKVRVVDIQAWDIRVGSVVSATTFLGTFILCYLHVGYQP